MEWCGGEGTIVSVEVGVAVGGGAVVIPEGPEDSKGVRSSAPANIHVGMEGEGSNNDMCQLC